MSASDSSGEVLLERLAEGTEELTQTGDIVGTLRFMAPERFESKSLPQSDVYALGLTLYELLTLRPAFDDTNKGRLIDKVLHEPPLPLRKLDPQVPLHISGQGRLVKR